MKPIKGLIGVVALYAVMCVALILYSIVNNPDNREAVEAAAISGAVLVEPVPAKPLDFTFDETSRIADMAVAWKAAYTDYGNWELAWDVDWNRAFLEHFDAVRNADREYSFFVEMNRFLAELGDGMHTAFTYDWALYEFIGNLPVFISMVEDDYYITTIRDDFYADLISGRVVAVNGIPMKEYLERYLFGFWGTQTPTAIYQNALDLFNSYGEVGTSLELTVYTKNGETVTDVFTYTTERTVAVNSNRLRRENNDFINTYEYDTFIAYETQNGVFIVRIDSFRFSQLTDQFDEFMNEVRDRAAGFIIDVRSNYGGFSKNSDAVLKWFVDMSELKPIQMRDQYITPDAVAASWLVESLAEGLMDFKDLGEQDINELLMLDHRYYIDATMDRAVLNSAPLEVPVLVLTSHVTVSCGEVFTDAAKAGGLTVIGTNTAGCMGWIKETKTPDGGKFVTSGDRDFTYDGYDYFSTGVYPDVWSELTVADLLAGEETIYKQALFIMELMMYHPEGFDVYMADYRYEYETKPLKTDISPESAVKRLSVCGDPDGVLTDGEKVLGLMEIWRRVTDFYNRTWSDTYISPQKWDSWFISYIPHVLAAENVADYYMVLTDFISLLKSPDTAVYADKTELFTYEPVTMPGPSLAQRKYAEMDDSVMDYSWFIAYEAASDIYVIRLQPLDGWNGSDFIAFIEDTAAKGYILDLRSVDYEYDINYIDLFKVLSGMKAYFNAADTEVVILVDGHTSMTAEYIANYAKIWFKYTIIGEETSGVDNRPAVFPLPEGGAFTVKAQTAKRTNGTNIVKAVTPDIAVADSDDGDAVMDAAVSYLLYELK